MTTDNFMRLAYRKPPCGQALDNTATCRTLAFAPPAKDQRLHVAISTSAPRNLRRPQRTLRSPAGSRPRSDATQGEPGESRQSPRRRRRPSRSIEADAEGIRREGTATEDRRSPP